MKIDIRSILRLTLLSGLLLAGCDSSDTKLHGYVEGKFTFLSSPNAGKLMKLAVDRGSNVKEGDFLFSLDPLPQSAELQSADALSQEAKSKLDNLKIGKRPTEIDAIESQIEQVKEKIKFLRKEQERFKILVQKSAIERQRFDQANQDLGVAINQLKELEADLSTAKLPARINEINAAAANFSSSKALYNKAQWALNEKSVSAPKDAEVFDTYYKIGETVPENKPVVSLLVPEDVIAVFFVPEPQLASVQINQSIQLLCDQCKQPYKAIIRFVSPQAEYTPPVIYSNSARSKLVFRVEAEIIQPKEAKLKPGQPIDIILSGNS